jgi:hypothetical protein
MQNFEVWNFHHTNVFDGPAETRGQWSSSIKRIISTMATAVTMNKIEKETVLVDEDIYHDIATE